VRFQAGPLQIRQDTPPDFWHNRGTRIFAALQEDITPRRKDLARSRMRTAPVLAKKVAQLLAE